MTQSLQLSHIPARLCFTSTCCFSLADLQIYTRWCWPSKFIMQYLHTSFLQNVLEVCHLSVEMHHRDLLFKHLTVQPHLLQQMDVQLPERYEKNVHRPCKNYATFSFYGGFSVTSISKAEMYFSSEKLCVWIFTALPLGSRIYFATVHLLLNILKTSNKYHNCTLVTIVIKQ